MKKFDPEGKPFCYGHKGYHLSMTQGGKTINLTEHQSGKIIDGDWYCDKYLKPDKDLPPRIHPQRGMSYMAEDPQNCVFCKRIQDKDFEWRNQWAIVFEPLNPVVPGHKLVIPAVHVKSAQSDHEIAGIVMEQAVYYANHVAYYNDVNFVTNSGVLAGQSVYHYHMHVIPRVKDDNLTWPWTAQKKE